ncbi:hydrogenase maturation peptidase HycI [Thermicanus aegyptius]|uniref:hydrogenase maturation peptidase HycI n=1 Tax=Thermicanus aegyptius TaxID=94009 RepID=UPI000406D6C3|nr:hydrogenase maturation peptidase HycI [Thermicanus aegyptius]
MNRLVITVGNEMMGDDGAGPLLARLLEKNPIPGWEVIDGGTMPENYFHQVQDMKPKLVVVVDACEMDLEVGSIRLVSERDIAQEFFLTTHRLPLSFFISFLKELVPDVFFVGIQPAAVSFGAPVSSAVKEAVKRVYETLKTGKPDFPHLT